MSFYTYNEYHLGDNHIFLHLLRALAKAHPEGKFLHACHRHLLPQMHEVVWDLPNIALADISSDWGPEARKLAVNTWKNAEGHWEKSPSRWDWPAHTLEHHEWTAKRMGLSSPFTCREHLLFDYPALSRPSRVQPREFLVGDSAPSSGQYSEWADHTALPMMHFTGLLGGDCITTTHLHRLGLTVSEIGALSCYITHHVMVANGPFWPTLNTHNNHRHEGRKRIVLLDNGENLNMPHITQCRNMGEVMEIAKQENWI